MSIRVLVADDHAMVRGALTVLVNLQNGMSVVGEADTGRRAVQLAIELSPDVVIMDVSMPDLNGIEATRRITAECPRCKVIAVAANSDRRYVTEMLKAGARAYLVKESAFEELQYAIRAVAAGKVFLSANIADSAADGYLHGDSSNGRPDAFAILTSREREVLQLIAEGLATKQIASRLHVSVKTVETHRRQLMQKADLHSVAALTKYALREGLASLDIIANTQ